MKRQTATLKNLHVSFLITHLPALTLVSGYKSIIILGLFFKLTQVPVGLLQLIQTMAKFYAADFGTFVAAPYVVNTFELM
jgi:hypothetical protein